MIRFALGVAVGYVLGTRAGRERYEDLVRTYHRMVDHPAVQGTAGTVRAKIDEKMGWSEKKAGRHDQGTAKAGQGDKLISEVDRQRASGGTAKPGEPAKAAGAPKSTAPTSTTRA
ncbi:hypothetical protein N8J89_07720 [Crossiella sp. CA-258035]|uniref:hypothetical protein n=1 Tax=Crossiella sp. CA-258035 TaxID=2981138 RepID=UPI0024BCD79C|nr:hypothetical protein [Crossiella sp. CA-258035]WHT23786.1 hypothetical protein N8J89_07720 [Crossiella sp. CA-258035]